MSSVLMQLMPVLMYGVALFSGAALARGSHIAVAIATAGFVAICAYTLLTRPVSRDPQHDTMPTFFPNFWKN